MVRGEIIIDENYCKGCGYCAHFCAKDCIVISNNKLSPKGYLLPDFANSENCTACGICAWMCPDFAIEIFKYIDDQEE